MAFENVTELKYLRTKLKNENYICGEMNSRINSGFFLTFGPENFLAL
jgi:hypothetical protein